MSDGKVKEFYVHLFCDITNYDIYIRIIVNHYCIICDMYIALRFLVLYKSLCLSIEDNFKNIYIRYNGNKKTSINDNNVF